METSEITSEGALILFTRYDLEVLHNVFSLINREGDPAAFEAASGSSFLEVQRMYEKVAATYKKVTEI